MIKTIVSEFRFQPSEIREMYVDRLDFQGIIYWYDEYVRIEKIRSKK